MKNYQIFRNDLALEPGQRSHGGVLVMVRNDVHAKTIPLNTSLQAIAVEIHTSKKFSLLNIYLPNASWTEAQLMNTISQVPQPVLVVGDFNCHSTLWGCTYTSAKGDLLENVINEKGLHVLNSGTPTHINEANGNFSAIDLSLASPGITLITNWEVMEDPHRSDHFPITIELGVKRDKYEADWKYNTKKADWNRFSEVVQTPNIDTDINQAVTEEAESRGFTFSGMKTRCLHFCRLRHKHEVPTLYLNETPIPNTQEIKFLGIILDSKLTWAKHINHLITKCKIIINRIRVIGSYTWGADRETLSKVINAFIGSRLQYGAEVYTNASKTYMNKIESVWNSALRIVTGAFRTSPIPSLNVESNSLPLRLRFEQQKFKHGVKRCAKPNHFLITL
ncbi:hypothetical protein PPYR_04538 [Photinus pyralis]|uniref:Endonuclease/exonuclease/phosphatase domain-containing protein n=1 Tax=Photinus pyralis TaxID=7054 RepID=A0A5N4AYB3_PHOPY|nr:hypothetical protein PPYR_04538 [Photinus pyralis]